MRTLLLLFLCLPFALNAQIAPNVVDVFPVPHSVGVLRSEAIIVNFDTTVSVVSVNNNSFRVFGRWSGPIDGSFSMQNSNQRAKFTPNQPFMTGEKITVMLSKDIISPVQLLNQPLAQAWSWTFYVEADPADLNLYPLDTVSVRYPAEGWVQAASLYGGDLNEDGHSDLSVVTEIGGDVRTLLNTGLGVFDGNLSDVKLTGTAAPRSSEAADFDNDNHIDIAVGSKGNNMVSVVNGDGFGNFSLLGNFTTGIEVSGLDVIDLNQDAKEDIITSNKNSGDIGLLLNDGTGTFFPATFIDPGGSGESAIAAGDMNNDGLRDVVVGAYGSEEFFILLSDGLGGLTVSHTFPASGKPWMIVLGDVNLDGNLDAVSANSDSNVVAVAYGNGTGQFSSVSTFPVGQFPISVDLGDLDGDGDLDLISSNYTSADFTFLENDGTGNFINPRTYGGISAGSSAIFHDRNTDGDMDLTLLDELEDVILTLDDDSTLAFLGLEEKLNQTLQLEIAPNPFQNEMQLHLNLPKSESLVVSVTDLSGRIIKRFPITTLPKGKHLLTLSFEEISSKGIFILSVQTNAYQINRRIVKF